MKIIKSIMIIILLLFLMAGSCKKEGNNYHDQLPPETQSGKNTFGCLINGQLWKNGKPIFGALKSFNANISNNTLGIGAISGESKTEKSIIISIQNFKGVKNYNFDNKNQTAGFDNFISNCFFTTDTIINSGELVITKFDSVNRIISGHFSFSAKIYSNGYSQSSSDCDAIVNVSEGRFDLIYTK